MACKISCLISGGVDSAVATLLLKNKGFLVEGVFLRLWEEEPEKEKEKKAKIIAKILKIPFSIIDLRKEFKARIVNYFLEEQKAGRTPNPCVLCNKEIKFGLALKKEIKIKADFIATGHYARIKKETKNSKFNKANFIYHLLKAKDSERDQSYFLWRLDQKKLKKILFPIGDLKKGEVDKIAKDYKLPVSKKEKSVELCFIKNNVNSFLKKYLKQKSGNIITKDGRVIGKHNGLWFYTIGQRKGIGLAGGPFYVLDKNLKNNELVVTKSKKDLFKKIVKINKVNWIIGKEPKLPMRCKAKVRYRQNSSSAIIKKDKKNNYFVEFKKPQFAPTPGQSLVFYLNNEMLGGGIIL